MIGDQFSIAIRQRKLAELPAEGTEEETGGNFSAVEISKSINKRKPRNGNNVESKRKKGQTRIRMLEEHKFPNDTINHFIYHPLNWQQVASGVVPHINARSLLVRYQRRCSFSTR